MTGPVLYSGSGSLKKCSRSYSSRKAKFPRPELLRPVETARRFLESAHDGNDPLYAVWVLILVLGLRKGEVLGLTWPTIDLDTAEVSLEWQLQRVGTQLIHKRQTKTDGSTDVLPLPDICITALQFQKD